MIATIYPGLLRGCVTPPPSKSLAHRLLIAAALGDGETRIHCPGENADMTATLRCLMALGGNLSRREAGWTVRGGLLAGKDPAVLPCGESGSTLRFLLPLCACLHRDITFTGEGRLPSRPNGPLIAALKGNGARLRGEGLPLLSEGGLQPGRFALPGDVSSQFFSGLLLALPLLPGDSTLHSLSPLASRPYVEMTQRVLAQFGICVETLADGWRIPGNQCYHSPGVAQVEGDWSAAAFWLGANALGSAIRLHGLDDASPQGDKAMGRMLDGIGGEINLSQTPDLMPILSVVAAALPGETRLTGAARLRIKESDRLCAMAEVIAALGGKAQETSDGLVIRGGKLAGGVVDGQNDHRVVMSAAIAATVCAGPVTIRGAQAVEKSYPGFFQDFAQLGGRVYVR